MEVKTTQDHFVEETMQKATEAANAFVKLDQEQTDKIVRADKTVTRNAKRGTRKILEAFSSWTEYA